MPMIPKLSRSNAEQMLNMIAGCRMTAESAIEAFSAGHTGQNDPYTQGNLQFWQTMLSALNWLESLIASNRVG